MSFQDIPIEVIRDEVFCYLDVTSLVTMCKVSRIYYDQLDENLWSNLGDRDFPGKKVAFLAKECRGSNRLAYQIFKCIFRHGKMLIGWRCTWCVQIRYRQNAVIEIDNLDDTTFAMKTWWKGNAPFE